jgi:class 3 adenylate cyclase
MRGRNKNFLAASLGKPKLSAVMSLLFVGLSVPILTLILIFTYYKNSAEIISIRDREVTQTRQVSVESTQEFINPIVGTLRLLAGMAAADPDLFRTKASRELLYRALTSSEQIDAVYASFEDGYHRVVTRIDDDRRRSDPRIPAAASWHSSYIDAFSASENRRRHRTFFDAWPRVIGKYSVGTKFDERALPEYQAVKKTGTLAFAGPRINPDTGYPVISLMFPIVHDDQFLGCIGANITLDLLSRFLENHRASPGSTTIIADRSDGQIIAYPDKEKEVRTVGDHLEVVTLDTITDPNLRAAYRQHLQTKEDDFLFYSPGEGHEYSASFASFPGDFGLPWEVIILTPTKDFVGSLTAANRQMIALIIALIAVEVVLIRILATRLSRPIEGISRQLRSVESLSFDNPTLPSSKIREIAQLQSAASLLHSSLQSFSSFVPLDIVRQLIASGAPLTLGAEERFLTVFFSDLEDFSTYAEQLPPNELLDRMSTYFEEVCRAISQEYGTVDKFIGDGVMAFWGAPDHRPDHVLRACAGALRASRRMQRIGDLWTEEGGRRMRIRIGLNCANVLVGNFGSSDRLGYTVMGDGVNVASRLEGLNKVFGTTICVSDQVIGAAGDRIICRPLRTLRVKGRESAFMVYELLGIKDSDDPELRGHREANRLCEMTWGASGYFERGDFVEAARGYRKILELFPSDPVARVLLLACARPVSDWQETANRLTDAGDG